MSRSARPVSGAFVLRTAKLNAPAAPAGLANMAEKTESRQKSTQTDDAFVFTEKKFGNLTCGATGCSEFH